MTGGFWLAGEFRGGSGGFTIGDLGGGGFRAWGRVVGCGGRD